MSKLPTLRTRYGEAIGVELLIQFPDLSSNEKTYFDADEAAAQTTLSANGTNFAVDQYVVLGNPGAEKTEIVKLHSSTAPTSTTITTGATTFAHSRGDRITFIPYNQIVVERSTDSGSNFSALTAVDIRPDASETYIQRTSDSSTDVYRFRFYNSTSGLYSAYSDNATASGFADNTVASIKRRALRGMGEKLGDLITDEFLNEALWEGRRELDQDERVLRWSFRTKFNTNIGACIPGRWSVATPTDIRDPNTDKNILSLRVGLVNRELKYLDLIRFNQDYRNIGHSTLNGQITAVSTSITLTESGNFDESGTVYVAAENVAGTLDAVAYTANNESTNVLSGVTGVATTHATGRDVWQDATFGLPTRYTIHDGTIYFDVPFSDDLAGEIIFMDYYKTLTAYDSDADTLDETEYDMFVPWLKWKIKYLKSNGTADPKTDGDYLEWEKRKTQLINKEITGQDSFLVPEDSWN